MNGFETGPRTDELSKSADPLWKTWDAASSKHGPRHAVYWVKKNKEYQEAKRLGLKMDGDQFLTGDVYVGDWEDNLKHGFGTQTWKNGEKYEGGWVHGKRQGKGTHWVKRSSGGKLRKLYTGDWVDNRMHGLGIYYYDNGDKYEGEWNDSQRHGKGKLNYANGDVYEGEWLEDKRAGLGVLTLDNGDRYEGHWMDDLKEGPGRYFYRSTRKMYEGEWMKDVAKCGVYKDNTVERFHELYDVADGSQFDLPALGLEDPHFVLSESIALVRQERSRYQKDQSGQGDQAVGNGEADSEVVFTPDEMLRLREEFKSADYNKTGVIQCGDLKAIFQALGMTPLDAEVDQLLLDINADASTEITFAEFVDIMALLSV